MLTTLIILIILAIGFDFLNGVHDSSNIVATMISSRAISPRVALAITAAAEFSGPFIFGVAVANTIGHEIVASEELNIYVLIAALISAITWNILTWLLGIPSSSSHALIGGIIGAVVVGAGFQAIKMSGVTKVLISLFASPIIGFIAGILIANLIFLLSWKSSPKINGVFKKLQVVTSVGLALSHGTNDAQKTMGIIAILVYTYRRNAGQHPQDIHIATWMIFACYTAIAMGTLFGGWRIVKTMGSKITKLRPVGGFCAETAAALTLFANSHLGIPVSTTHTITGAIMGVGATQRLSAVRWGVATQIVWAWFLTIPCSAFVAALSYVVISLFL